MSFDPVYKLVKQIPRGRVLTYGALAKALRLPGGARTAGRAMGATPKGKGIPLAPRSWRQRQNPYSRALRFPAKKAPRIGRHFCRRVAHQRKKASLDYAAQEIVPCQENPQARCPSIKEFCHAYHQTYTPGGGFVPCARAISYYCSQHY